MTIGGQGIVAQMTAIDAEHADELARRLQGAQRRAARDVSRRSTSSSSSCPGSVPRAESSASSPRSGTARSRSRSRASRRSRALSTSSSTHEDTERHKPDPDPVLLAVERLGGTPADAAYVGDSPFDIGAAKAAGVFSIAVGLGRDPSRTSGCWPQEPDAFVRTPQELAACPLGRPRRRRASPSSGV